VVVVSCTTAVGEGAAVQPMTRHRATPLNDRRRHAVHDRSMTAVQIVHVLFIHQIPRNVSPVQDADDDVSIASSRLSLNFNVLNQRRVTATQRKSRPIRLSVLDPSLQGSGLDRHAVL